VERKKVLREEREEVRSTEKEEKDKRVIRKNVKERGRGILLENSNLCVTTGYEKNNPSI
jgi:hypothetical protein